MEGEVAGSVATRKALPRGGRVDASALTAAGAGAQQASMVRHAHLEQSHEEVGHAECRVAHGHGEQGDEWVVGVKEEQEEEDGEEWEDEDPLASPHVHWSRNGELFPADADNEVAPGVGLLTLTSPQQIAQEGRVDWIRTTETLRWEQVDWDPIAIMSLMKCYEDQEWARGTPVTRGADYFIRGLVCDYYILQLHTYSEGQVVPPFYCAHLLGSSAVKAEEDVQLVPPSFDAKVTMAYGYICEAGRIVVWTTEVFAAAYVSADAVLEDVRAHGTLPEDRFAARTVFYEELFKCCATSRQATFEVEMLRPDNTPQRATLEVWPVLRKRGGYFSLCITVTEIVDAGPHKRKTVTDADACYGRNVRIQACQS